MFMATGIFVGPVLLSPFEGNFFSQLYRISAYQPHYMQACGIMTQGFLRVKDTLFDAWYFWTIEDESGLALVMMRLQRVHCMLYDC